MALEIEGTISQKLPVQSGNSARGPWAKQEFILEFPDGNFTAKACFTAWAPAGAQPAQPAQPAAPVQTAPPAFPQAPAPTLEDMPAEDGGEDLPF